MSIEGHANVLLFDFFALQAAPLRTDTCIIVPTVGMYRVQVQRIQLVSL